MEQRKLQQWCGLAQMHLELSVMIYRKALFGKFLSQMTDRESATRRPFSYSSFFFEFGS